MENFYFFNFTFYLKVFTFSLGLKKNIIFYEFDCFFGLI